MVSQGDDDDGVTDTDRSAFVSKLRELKEDGSALLVVGSVPDTAAIEACHWLFGDDTVRERRRLFVSTDPDRPGISDRLSTPPDQLHPETTRLVTWTAASRSTATTSPSRPPEPPYDEIEPVRVESDDLGELGIAISREIETFEDVAGGLSPSELRVCFDSLAALSANCDRSEVFQFLHVLVGRIRSARAMAHFHLPVDYDSTIVRQFTPIFDAAIELRIADGTPEQRWHLLEEGLSSEWLTPSRRQ